MMEVNEPLVQFDGSFSYVYESERRLRIDQYLKGLSTFVSRNFWVRAISSGLILHNGAPAKKSATLRPGDHIHFDYYDLYRKLTGECLKKVIPYKVLESNENFIIIDKPSGFLIHRVGFIDWSVVSKVSEDEGQKMFIVHRLDKHTSGVCILARSSKKADILQNLLRASGFQKYYIVGSEKRLPNDSGLFEGPIGKDDPRIHKKKQKVDYESGLASKTRYRYIGSKGQYFYYLVRIFTGRQHQIRVHFQHGGAPVANDELYSYDDYSHLGLMYSFSEEDLGLHAVRLRFQCPFKNVPVVATSLPERAPF